MPLLTRRLQLAPFDLADAADLFAIRGDPEAMRFWDWPGDAMTEQTNAHALVLLGEMRAGRAIHYTARLADGGFVGLFDLSDLHRPDAELGFLVVRHRWGQGLATEAAHSLVEEAWGLGKHALKARIHAGNDASRRLLFKLGFLRQGPETLVEVAPGRRVMCERFRLDRPTR